MKQEDETLGVYIQRRRAEVGLSLRQLAEKSGINKGYLSRVENGERSPTSAVMLKQLADALEVDVEELRTLSVDVDSLPSPRAYFRRKLGIDAAQADVLAKLVEDYQRENEEARDENTNQD
jgi:transcriptional regulator with XRE-family HTH domain